MFLYLPVMTALLTPGCGRGLSCLHRQQQQH